MKPSMSNAHRLYRAAIEADEAFTQELKRVYGARAADGRYRWKHDDEALMRAMRRKLAADKAWWLAQVNGASK